MTYLKTESIYNCKFEFNIQKESKFIKFYIFLTFSLKMNFLAYIQCTNIGFFDFFR